jgi:hypothetical protein
MHNELNLLIGVQHSGAIWPPVGDQIQACPNQAVMLQDLSAWPSKDSCRNCATTTVDESGN